MLGRQLARPRRLIYVGRIDDVRDDPELGEQLATTRRIGSKEQSWTHTPEYDAITASLMENLPDSRPAAEQHQAASSIPENLLEYRSRPR